MCGYMRKPDESIISSGDGIAGVSELPGMDNDI